MDIDTPPRDFRMVLRASFDPATGVLELSHRSQSPAATYGSALAICLTPDEARLLGAELVAFASVA